MQPDQQQRIMGYFIEEAKDHLNTIEQGLLNLQQTIEDPEMVNEVFRAAHSVKGGAAMLGLGSIQHVSHRLEDFFKVLKEMPVRVDQKLETLFLRAFDSLQELLGQLQGPFGLTEESANGILAGVEPTFEELEQHLAQLATESGGISLPTTTGFGLDTGFTLPVNSQVEESLANLFRTDVTLQLREMLRLFRLSDSDPAVRRQLQDCCENLSSFGNRYGLSTWCNLLATTRRAIANSSNSYRILAPVVIKDIKQSQELVLAGREHEIYPSIQLQDLVSDASVETVIQEDLSDLLADLQPLSSEFSEVDQPLELSELEFEQSFATADSSFESLEISPADGLNFGDDFEAQPFPTHELESQHGPEVGMAELNTLADLFEGEVPDLGLTWHQEDVIEDRDDLLETGSQDTFGTDSNNDFSDLLFEENRTEAVELDSSSAVDDLDRLFDDDDLLVEENTLASETDTSSLFGSDPLAGDSDLNLDEMDDLLNISESSFSGEVDQGLVENPLSDLGSAFADLDLTNAELPMETQSDSQVETAQPNEESGDLSNLFDELDDEGLIAEDQSLLSPSFEAPIPDPWDARSDNAPLPEVGPELGSLSLEDLDLAQFDIPQEELSSYESVVENLSHSVAPLSPSGWESESHVVSDAVTQPDAIADPWEDTPASTLDSLPLSDLSLDELDVSTELPPEAALVEEPESAAELELELRDFDFSDQLEEDLLSEDLFNAAVSTDELLFEPVTQSAQAEDDLFEDGLISSSDLLGEDLFGEPSEPSSATDLDNLFGEPGIPSDGLIGDLFGESGEPENSDLNEFFSEPADQTSSDMSELFGDSTGFSPSVDTLFEESDVASTSQMNDLFGELNFADAEELPQDDLNDSELGAIFGSSDEITNILEEDSAELSMDLDEGSPELSDQELDELLGGASDQEMEDLLGESFTLDVELMAGLDLEPEAIAEPAPAADFNGFAVAMNEGFYEVPTTAPIEEESSASELDLLDLSLTDEPFSVAQEETGNDADLESSLSDSTFEAELDFSQSLDNAEGFTTEFGELDSLLDESSTTVGDFSDLEGLLNGEPLSEPEQLSDATPSLEGFEESLVHDQPSSDEFSNLETLVEGSALGLSAAGAMGLASSPDTSNVESSEFDDLDDLLKDAEEKMGGSPSITIGRGAIPPARRVMRPGRVFSEQTMRVPVKHLDNLSNLVGELVVNRNSLEQDQERLRQSLDNLLYQVQQLSDVGQRMQDLYERSLLESSLLASRKSHHPISAVPSASSGGTTVTEIQEPSSTVEYDPLEMDRFTGFHSLSQEMIELIVRVRESSSDIEFIVDETEQVTRMFRQVTTQLQEGLTRSRMVPFAQTADRLPRAVRDISMKVGKQAELAIEGRETLIDKMILEQLYDPMTHLVNNALTHGIEPPEVRRAQGKPPAGRISIRAFHQGNQTIISVFDDGSGIDVERVKAKAIEKGLITAADAQHLSRLDIYDILFHPGFTTKDQADDFSGRGVGMDVVRTSLSEIRGVVNIDSTPGKGTTFTIRLPLTLSISKALCCISDRARIAFPMDGVEDMLDLPRERLQVNADGQPCIAWRDTILSIRPLADLLTYNRHLSRGNVYGGNQEDDIVSVVVLRSAGNFLALQVDQVLGEQEIVIKQLEGPVPKPAGVAGATVLGDGRIMPIADVLELIDLSMGRLRRDAGGALWDQGGDQEGQEAPPIKTEPMVLIVDDSITVRELLSMTFNKVGYRVEQARDGQEAWEKLRSGLPCDIVFCDIEMPRMDGLELLSRIQKDPNLKQLPIAMLTSRGADRHRQMAASLGASGYFTKPYLEEALLDAAQRMLKGERLLSSEG